MQYHKDFVSREIQRLVSFLNNLISKIKRGNSVQALTFEEIEIKLKEELKLNLSEILSLEREALTEKLKQFDEEILEKLVELIIEIQSNKLVEVKTIELLSRKGFIILDFIEKQTSTYSFKREHLKSMLRYQNDTNV